MNTEQTDPTLDFLISQGFSPTILTRFWAKVKKSPEPHGCWLWTGATNGVGYGKIATSGHSGRDYAHRVSWVIHRGKIPPGMSVLHDCPDGDNPACVNPAHLKIGTKQANQADMAKKGRSHRGYKLTDQQVREIRALRPLIRGKELALRYRVSQATISEIVHGGTHSCLLSGVHQSHCEPRKD